MSVQGKSIRLFLVEGTSGGLTVAEIVNWTGQVVSAPRADLAQLKSRPEVSRSGVYFLFGEDPERPGTELGYIGESEDIGKRLYDHDRKKDWWERVVVLTSKDANLTKGHIRYLEARLIQIAQSAGRMRLSNETNGVDTTGYGLPEADRSDMEYFIAQAQIVLPVLGINLLRPTRPPETTPVSHAQPVTVDRVSPLFRIVSPKLGVDAIGQEIDGEFIVREGSKIRIEHLANHTRQNSDAYRSLWFDLERRGIIPLTADGTSRVFAQDWAFTSSTPAACIVTGTQRGGPATWKTKDGLTYGHWRDLDSDVHSQTRAGLKGDI